MALRQIQALLISTVIWTLIFINATGQQIQKERYLITGTIKSIDSGIVRMISATGTNVLDSAVIVNGNFSMQGKIGTPERLLFTIFPGNLSFRAFVEDARIILSIDTAGAEHHGSGKDKWALIWNIEETGSELADVYTKYISETSQKYYAPIFSSLRKKLKAANGNKDAEAKVTREMDSITSLLLANQKAWIENYISQYPSSIAGAYLFYEFFQTYEFYQSMPTASLSYLSSILNKFSEPATSSHYYQELADKAINLRNIQAGSSAPDFTLLKSDKSKFTLSSTRGSYTLIDFWASWCLPCRKAIPAWKEVYAKYKGKGFTIVGVSSDRNWNDWIKALNKEQMSWMQVIDEFSNESDPALVTNSFGTNGLPFYVLLDKDGKVILSSNDKEIVRKKIEEMFQ